MGRGRYIMGCWIDIPWVGVDISWIGGSIYSGKGGRYVMGRGGQYTMHRGVDIP